MSHVETHKPYVFSEPNMAEGLPPVAEELCLGYVTKPTKLLEIGIYDGRSACWFLDNILLHSQSQYFGVEVIGPYKAAFERALLNLSRHRKKTRIVTGSSIEVLPMLLKDGHRFDIIYVDGCHAEQTCTSDLKCSWKMLKPQGILLCDDYAREDYGVMAAVDKFLEQIPKTDYEVLYRDYKIAWRKICAS